MRPRTRLVSVAFVMALLSSCSLFASPYDADGTGVAPDGGPGSDAMPSDSAGDGADIDPGPPPCDLGKPFGTPTRLSGLSSPANEVGVTLTADENVAIIDRWGYGVMQSGRSSRAAPFDPPYFTGVAADNGSAALSADGLTLVLAGHVPDAGDKLDLYRAVRQDVTGAFGETVSVPAVTGVLLNTESWESTPHISPLGICFASDRAGTFDLYCATLDGQGTATAVEPVPGPGINLNPGKETSPVMSADGLRIYFSSDRPSGKGNDDIWTASRAKTSEPFGQLTNVAELNSAMSEQPSWISSDGCRLYFHQFDPEQGWDVLVAEKPQ